MPWASYALPTDQWVLCLLCSGACPLTWVTQQRRAAPSVLPKPPVRFGAFYAAYTITSVIYLYTCLLLNRMETALEPEHTLQRDHVQRGLR